MLSTLLRFTVYVRPTPDSLLCLEPRPGSQTLVARSSVTWLSTLIGFVLLRLFIAGYNSSRRLKINKYSLQDPEEYLVHYENMLEFLGDSSNHKIMQEELSARGVKCINFYDIVIDFILLDSFDEVDKPPSSIKAILQNRWISASFRKTVSDISCTLYIIDKFLLGNKFIYGKKLFLQAVGTAVWSILASKRQMLKYNKGFLTHFYFISEQVSPVLVWGFLGPEGSLRSTCQYFRDQVVEFLVDIFNFFKVRYTNIDELAEDIWREMRIRVENINQRLALEGCWWFNNIVIIITHL